MKLKWKHIYPGLFGLLIYATIRVINDTISGFRFWERGWPINILEISVSVAMGYGVSFALRKIFKKFDKDIQHGFSYKIVLKEFFWVFFIIEVCINAIATPMAALTDDGLSWGDLATINIIPVLFCMIYYGVVR